MGDSIRGGHQLSVLSAIMARLPPASVARRDFAAECARMLGNAPLDPNNHIRVSPNMWDYWSAVATGKSDVYEVNGGRRPGK
jgi:hypothetical protein